MKFKLILLFCLLGFAEASYCQKISVIQLHKGIYPIVSYNPAIQDAIVGRMDSAEKSSWHNSFFAGDYADSITKFRIVVFPPGNEVGDNTYIFNLAPYKCDTVYVGDPSISGAEISYPTVIAGMGKRKFKITILPGNKAMQVIDVSTEYVTPDIKLPEDKLPDMNFTLIDGGTKSLTSFERQRKLIYLYFWTSPDCKDCLVPMDKLKDIYSAYKNKLSIISLFDPDNWTHKQIDTDMVKKVITDKQLQFTEGYSDISLLKELLIMNMGGQYGMLFDENGNVLKRFIMPEDLEVFLKKKYGN